MENHSTSVQGSIGTAPYLTTIKWDKGEIITDEPSDKGGSGLYPDPFSLLAASLAGCTLITLRMYLDRKDWKVDFIKVSISVDQHVEGIETTTSFTKHLEFQPEVTAEQLLRLHIIANKCPVAKTLSGKIELITQ